LRHPFEQHLEETKGHVERLDDVFEALDERARGKHCDGILGRGDGHEQAVALLRQNLKEEGAADKNSRRWRKAALTSVPPMPLIRRPKAGMPASTTCLI